MYFYILVIHSAIRWLVLLSLSYSIYIGFKGWFENREFQKKDNLLRHSTATISHVQLTIGYILYFISPIVESFKLEVRNTESIFFSMIHITLMTISVFIITIGSSLSKRKETNIEKFKTMAIWFSIALIIIFFSIPWYFSPFVSRPYIRTF